MQSFKNIHGRMGIPFHQEGISVVSITMIGSMDEINSFTGKLGSIDSVQVKQQFPKRNRGSMLVRQYIDELYERNDLEEEKLLYILDHIQKKRLDICRKKLYKPKKNTMGRRFIYELWLSLRITVRENVVIVESIDTILK